LEESEREKERKENMRCKVSSSLILHMENKKMKKSVDFSKAKTGEIFEQLLLCFNN